MYGLKTTPRTSRIITNAKSVAEKYHACYIGTDHLLLGMLMEEGGSVPCILSQCGIDPNKLREQVTKIVEESWGPPELEPEKPDLKAVAKVLRSLVDLIEQ